MLEQIYQQILEAGREGGAGSKFIRLSELYAGGVWQRGIPILKDFSRPFDGGTFLDFGCKFGHLTPVIQSLGAGEVINVDVDDEYLRDGSRFIGEPCRARFVKSDECYIEVEGSSVDFVFAKEVISHINPTMLPTFFSEVARVLKPGGEIVISDANNLDLPEIRESLVENYCAWEHGTSKELGSNYQVMRERKIAEAFPDLPEDKVSYYARNTSGLYGERLLRTVGKAVDGEPFTERPHRRGQLPIHPNYGTAMEHGFHASEIVSALEKHGLAAEVLPQHTVAFVVRGRRAA